MQFGQHLSEAVMLFNEGDYSACLHYCAQLVDNGARDSGSVYLGALAGQNAGDYFSAMSLINRAPEISKDAEISQLKIFIKKSIETINLFPEPLRTIDWYQEKSVLRIGGRIRLLDYLLENSKTLIDTNATEARFGKANRVDILGDAHQLPDIKSQSVHLVASSHTIEHLVNPLLALREWARTLVTGGYIYSVLPNYAYTFDHRRTPTSMEHLIADLESESVTPDWTHIVEFLRNHDCERDLVFKGDKKAHFEEFMKAPHLHTHYHVFDLPLTFAIHEYSGFKTLACFESEISVHYVGIKQ